MMKYLQKLGKSLMLPVACLPAAGILMGIGYWISPSVMSGVGDPNVFAFFLVKALRSVWPTTATVHRRSLVSFPG